MEQPRFRENKGERLNLSRFYDWQVNVFGLALFRWIAAAANSALSEFILQVWVVARAGPIELSILLENNLNGKSGNSQTDKCDSKQKCC